MPLNQGVDALLSFKDHAFDDLLSAAPTLEGKLQTALLKIGRMEDMDTQLRSQLEKIISQRNQLSAEKAARDIENQHLQAQVELLEADSAGRHSADSRCGSPRESVESLQADNARLRHQVEAAVHEISQRQAQLQHTHQQLPQHRQNTFSSFDASTESQLRAQISKSEYEVARQAAQILELQGELTKVQVSFDRSAQRQTESNAQLTRQESTVSRYTASNMRLQDQLQEAQITAASQQARITQLESELMDNTNSQSRAREQHARLETEAKHQQELAAKRYSEVQKLQTQLDESTAAAASAAAAEQQLRGQLQVQEEEQSRLKKQYDEKMEGAQASAKASASKQESLEAEVLSIKTKADEQLVQLQAQHQEVQSLQQKLQSAVTDKAASERSLSEQSVRSRNELAEQHDTVKKLQEQLTDAQTKLSQVQSDRAEEERQAGAQKEAASKQRQEVSELQAQLTKAQEEVASFADIRIHLQQQLGERTIVLGQKAHQIAHLTAQLNEARALSRSSHGLGKAEDTKPSLSPAQQSQAGTASPRQLQKSNESSASASASPVATPLQSALAADKDQSNSSDAEQSQSTKGDGAVENRDSPVTPLQTDPSYPQRQAYTPSESGPSTGARTSAGPESVPKRAQQGSSGTSGGHQIRSESRPVLEGRFDQVDRDVGDHVGDSDSIPSVTERSPQQQRSAVATAENGGLGGHVQSQLSSPQSCPSTPASQMGITLDSGDGYRSVTHVNSCFAKSDDEGELDDLVSSSSGSQLVHDDVDQDDAVAEQQTDGKDQSLSMSDKLHSHSTDLKAALKSKSQAAADAKEANKQARRLEECLAERQTALNIATERAISAEVDLKAALKALSDTEKVMSVSVYRKEAAELISVISGCIAAFVMAAATTVYWLH